MNTEPLVSILMPCYNAEVFVEESLQSILNQTYTNLEIIAINDCSTDNTLAILQRLASEDSRVKVHINRDNLRLINTLNHGVTLCQGDYIARMDSDDRALPTRIEKQVAFLQLHGDYDIVSTQFETFPSSNPSKLSLHHNPCKHEELCAYMLFKSGICHPAVMIRKRLFTELGLGFGLKYLHVEDYALWSEAIYLTKIANLDESLLHYRVHQHQVSVLNEQLQIKNKKKVFEIHCKHLGLDYSDKALDIYLSVAEANPSISSIDYLDKCEEFMLSLIKKNEDISFCDHNYLLYMLSLHWLRLCANSRLGLKAIKRAKKSLLFQPQNYSKRDKLIMYIKCLFRIEYKKSYLYKIIFR